MQSQVSSYFRSLQKQAMGVYLDGSAYLDDKIHHNIVKVCGDERVTACEKLSINKLFRAQSLQFLLLYGHRVRFIIS